MVIENLDYEIAACSGWDDECLPTQIQELKDNVALKSKGWQSARFCTYPQYLVLRLPSICRVRKVQILSHHFKISSRIEIFVGSESSSSPKSSLSPSGIGQSDENGLKVQGWRRLGFIGLSDNVSTGFRARELKTVHLDFHGDLLKFQFNQNFVNPLNLYNQVGVIALSLSGEVVDTEFVMRIMGESTRLQYGMDPLEPEAFVDPMTLGLINRTTGHDQDADMRTVSTKDESIRAMLRSVRKAKDTAVKDEKFVQAKQLKGLMELLQKAAEEVAKLEIIKANAIHHEDYDLAENIKLDIGRIKMALRTRFSSTGFQVDDFGAILGVSSDRNLAATESSRDIRLLSDEDQVIDRPKSSQMRSHSQRLEIGSKPAAATTTSFHAPNPASPSVPITKAPISPKPPATHLSPKLAPAVSQIPVSPRAEQALLSAPRSRAPTISKQSVINSHQPANAGHTNPIDEIPTIVQVRVSDETPLPAPKAAVVLDEYPAQDETSSPLSKPKPKPKTAPLKKGAVKASESSKSPQPPPSESNDDVEIDDQVIRTRASTTRAVLESKKPPASFPKGLEDPEPLSPRDEDDYNGATQIFGLIVIQCLLSKQFKLREWAMSEILRAMREMEKVGDEVVKAVLQIVGRTLQDSREKVSLASVGLWQTMTELTRDKTIDRLILMRSYEPLVSTLLIRCAETNPRIRQASEDLMLLLVGSHPNTVVTQMLKTFPKKLPLFKQVKARIEIVVKALVKYGIEESPKSSIISGSGFSVDKIMEFVFPQLSHTNGEVRDAGANAVFELCKLVGKRKLESHFRGMKPMIAQGILTRLEDKKTKKKRDSVGVVKDKLEIKLEASAGKMGAKMSKEASRATGVEAEEESQGRSALSTATLRPTAKSPSTKEAKMGAEKNKAPNVRSAVAGRSSERVHSPASRRDEEYDDEEKEYVPRSKGDAIPKSSPKSPRGLQSPTSVGTGRSSGAGSPAPVDDSESNNDRSSTDDRHSPKKSVEKKKKRRFFFFGRGGSDSENDAEKPTTTHVVNQIVSPAMSRARLEEIDAMRRDAKGRVPGVNPESVSNNWNIDRTCIFCDERNQTFSEDVLDLHYWQDCPVLLNCPACTSIVEVSALHDHLVQDCAEFERGSEISGVEVCKKCGGVLIGGEVGTHSSKKKGVCPGKKQLNVCPLCHGALDPSASGLKSHLLNGRGCPRSRRKPRVPFRTDHVAGGANRGGHAVESSPTSPGSPSSRIPVFRVR